MKAFHEIKSYSQNIPVHIFKATAFNFMAHWHIDIEFACVLNGSMIIGINSDHRLLTKGEAAMCGSGDIHSYTSMSDDSEVIIVRFRPEFIDCVGCWPKNIKFKTAFIDKQLASEANLPESFESSLIEIFTKLYAESEQNKDHSIMFIKSKLYELCGIALRYLPGCETVEKMHNNAYSRIEPIQHALSFIADNYTSDISLFEVADEVGLSAFHFSRLFKEICGKSFKNYVNATKIHAAEKLMCSTEKSILDISLDCGFNSIRTFNRVFKQLKGCTPKYIRTGKIPSSSPSRLPKLPRSYTR